MLAVAKKRKDDYFSIVEKLKIILLLTKKYTNYNFNSKN